MVGRLIGKRGATLSAIKAACAGADVVVASKPHSLKPTRLVTVRAAEARIVAETLDEIARKVPDLVGIMEAAKTYLHEAFLVRAASE